MRSQPTCCRGRLPDHPQMHAVLSVLLFAFLVGSLPAGEWPGKKFTTVRGYYYNAGSEHDRKLIDRSGKLDASIVNKEGAELNAAQTARLLALIRTSAAVQPVTSCYVPHHGFVFTNALGQRVGVFEFCLECLKATPVPNTAGPYFDYVALAELLHELKLPIGPKFRTPAEYKRFHAKRLKGG